MPQQIPLTADEIRTGMMIIVKFREAQARLMMAQEMKDEYLAQLSTKYGLGEAWVCLDLLDGFVNTSVAQGTGTA